MSLCVQHYYATRDPLGAGGDFTTAPEISQMFGELIGLWMLEAWHGMGRPRPCRPAALATRRGDMGPGRCAGGRAACGCGGSGTAWDALAPAAWWSWAPAAAPSWPISC